MLPVNNDRQRRLLPDQGFLRHEHFPLRGTFLTRDYARVMHQPRWQLVPAKPVATPGGPSTMLTEFGWVTGRFETRLSDDRNAEILRSILQEFETDEMPANVMPIYFGIDRALVPLKFTPSTGEDEVPAPARFSLPLPLALLHAWSAARMNRKLPFNMKPRVRRQWSEMLRLLQDVGSALVDTGPLSQSAPISLCLTPQKDGKSALQILSHASAKPGNQGGPSLTRQTPAALPLDTADGIIELVEIMNAIVGKSAISAVMLLGDPHPTGHRMLEAAATLEAWRKSQI